MNEQELVKLSKTLIDMGFRQDRTSLDFVSFKLIFDEVKFMVNIVEGKKGVKFSFFRSFCQNLPIDWEVITEETHESLPKSMVNMILLTFAGHVGKPATTIQNKVFNDRVAPIAKALFEEAQKFH